MVKIHLGIETDFRPARKAHPALLVQDLQALKIRMEAAGFLPKADEPLAGYDRVYAFILVRATQQLRPIAPRWDDERSTDRVAQMMIRCGVTRLARGDSLSQACSVLVSGQ